MKRFTESEENMNTQEMVGTVSSGSLIAMVITFFVATILPVLVLVVYAVKNKKQGLVGAWFLGAAGFFVPQILIRIPILSMLQTSEKFLAFAENYYVVYVLSLAFTAGLFETLGRYGVAKILKKNGAYKKAIAAGLGHGGIEAIILIGMGYISNLVMALMINNGTIEVMIKEMENSGADASTLYAAVGALVNTATYEFLLAGVERIFTMIIHTVMSVMVCYFVWNNKTKLGVLYCIAFHTLLDGVGFILISLSTPYFNGVLSRNACYVLEYIFLGMMTVVSVFILRYFIKKWKQEG